MKYGKFILLIICAIIFTAYDCSAYDHLYGYNYEVTSVTFDGTYGSLSGWAILNGGVNDSSNDKTHGSPPVDRSLGSTSNYWQGVQGKNYKYSETNHSYEYSLRIYGINLNNGKETEVGYIEATKVDIPLEQKMTLSWVMCFKNSGNCVEENSSYYDNVNYKFTFNFNNFYDSSKFKRIASSNLGIDAYKFVLTVKSTQNNCTNSSKCSQSFPLAFLESAVDKSAKRFFDTGSYMDKIVFVANNAWIRSGECSTGSTLKKIENAGGTFDILGTTYCAEKQLTYYKIKYQGKEGWIPASWIAPPKSDYTRIIPSACNVDGESLNFNGTTNKVISNSCGTLVNLKDNLSDDCITTDKTKYYTISCQDNISTEFNPSKSKYYRGDDFMLGAKIASQVTCTGTFDYNLWSKAYSKADTNDKKVLNDIKNNFINFTMKEYKMNPTGVMTYKVSETKNAKMDLKIVSNTKLENGTTKPEVTYTSASKQVPKSFVYKTDKIEVKMELNNPIVVDEDKESTPYQVAIKNAGFSSKSVINFDCAIVKILAIYRPVDVNDPFISLNTDREIGENWSNDKFDFVKIIDKETWNESKTPLYVFSVSTSNIKAIVKNNAENGLDAYLGKDCYYQNTMKKYYCPFLRNTQFVTRLYVDGVWH